MSAEYFSSMLSLAAAACAPLRIRSQKLSPGASWVIIATVARGVFATPALPPPDEVFGLPPVLEHAASAVAASTTPTAMEMRRTRRRDLSAQRFCGPCRDFMGTPSRMKLDATASVGRRSFALDVIRITCRSQYFVRTLGLQVKCQWACTGAAGYDADANLPRNPTNPNAFHRNATGFPDSTDSRTAAMAAI